MSTNLETRFDEKESLRNILTTTDENHSRNIVGRSLLHWHCGERKLKIQEIQYIVYANGRLILNPLAGKLLYCVKCGDLDDTYPTQ